MTQIARLALHLNSNINAVRNNKSFKSVSYLFRLPKIIENVPNMRDSLGTEYLLDQFSLKKDKKKSAFKSNQDLEATFLSNFKFL